MLYNCYLRKGIVYVPTVGKMETGGYREIAPVTVAPVSHDVELKNSLREAFSRDNRIVPGLARAGFPEPVLPKYAGVKSYAAFARGTSVWNVIEDKGVYQIIGQRKMLPRGWEDDPDQTITLPAGSSIDDLCDRLIAILQAKAAHP
jgi:hypothetical protein